MNRCKMSALKVGDVFTFGSPERNTVQEVHDGYLMCKSVDAYGALTAPSQRMVIQDAFVICEGGAAAPKAAAPKAAAPKAEVKEEAATESAPKRRKKTESAD